MKTQKKIEFLCNLSTGETEKLAIINRKCDRLLEYADHPDPKEREKEVDYAYDQRKKYITEFVNMIEQLNALENSVNPESTDEQWTKYFEEKKKFDEYFDI